MSTLLINNFSKNPLQSKTQFGGQPGWLEAPVWPMSESTGHPMKFIGQIDLSESVFAKHGFQQKMAYIFMTDEEEWVDGTYLIDGGENAVIIQAGEAVIKSEKGPTFSDEAYYPVMEPAEANLDQGFLGGEPLFIQSEEYPEDPDNWFFLWQINALPFEVNFGDSGIGYVFARKDGQKGAFHWQCF